MDVFRIHKEWVDEKVVGLRDRCVGGCVCGFIGMWVGVCSKRRIGTPELQKIRTTFGTLGTKEHKIDRIEKMGEKVNQDKTTCAFF